MLIDRAVYGRMALGRCVTTDLGHLGCQNDVHLLVDKWCSGLQECQFLVPNDPTKANMKSYNTKCLIKGLSLYLNLDYHCAQGKLNLNKKLFYINIHVQNK